MHLNFDKIKAKQESGGGSQWTSYSDLFMVLSCVFLILYVVASFRTGAMAISSKLEILKVNVRMEELKDHIKIYERIKDDYVQENASEEDKKLYQEVIQHLVLLEDEAAREKEHLAMLSEEQAKREKKLNRYQEIIKNVITANMSAKSEIHKREKTIKEKQKDISTLNRVVEQKENTIKEIEDNIKTKENEIQKKENEIETTQTLLAKQQAETRQLQEVKERIKNELQNEINKKGQKIAMLSETLQEKDSTIRSIEEEIKARENEIETTQSLLAKQQAETRHLQEVKERIRQNLQQELAEKGQVIAMLNETLQEKDSVIKEKEEKINACGFRRKLPPIPEITLPLNTQSNSPDDSNTKVAGLRQLFA